LVIENEQVDSEITRTSRIGTWNVRRGILYYIILYYIILYYIILYYIILLKGTFGTIIGTTHAHRTAPFFLLFGQGTGYT